VSFCGLEGLGEFFLEGSGAEEEGHYESMRKSDFSSIYQPVASAFQDFEEIMVCRVEDEGGEFLLYYIHNVNFRLLPPSVKLPVSALRVSRGGGGEGLLKL